MANKKTQNSEPVEEDQSQVVEPLPDEIPARRLLHKLFILVSVLTALVALWMGAGQILGIVVYKNGPVDYVLRGYVILLCILVILVELEWPAFARESVVLHNWVSRGLLYVFIGVIGMQENETAELANEENESYEMITDIVKAVAWNMAGCGVLYFVMGVLCLQFVLRRLRKDYQARLQLAKERKKQAQEGPTNDIEAQSGDASALDDNLEAKDTPSVESDETHQESDVANENDEAQESSVDVLGIEAQKEHGVENSTGDSNGSSIKDENEDKDEEAVASSASADDHKAEKD